jgi:hypothetical protein
MDTAPHGPDVGSVGNRRSRKIVTANTRPRPDACGASPHAVNLPVGADSRQFRRELLTQQELDKLMSLCNLVGTVCC